MESQPTLNGLARDLEAIIRRNVLGGPSTSTALIPEGPQPDSPAFGDVYFGSMADFAGGDPHYAMVTRRKRSGDVWLAPITDGEKKRSRTEFVVALPPKTLPPKRTPTGREFITSHVLLKIRSVITVEQLRIRQFRYIKRLPEEYRSEALAKLRVIGRRKFSR